MIFNRDAPYTTPGFFFHMKSNHHVETARLQRILYNKRWPILTLLATIIACLYVIEFVVKNNLAPQGITLYEVNLEIREQQADNYSLQAEILHSRSLGAIEAKARAEGFIPYDLRRDWIVGNPLPRIQ